MLPSFVLYSLHGLTLHGLKRYSTTFCPSDNHKFSRIVFVQVMPDFSELFVTQAAFSGLEELLRMYK